MLSMGTLSAWLCYVTHKSGFYVIKSSEIVNRLTETCFIHSNWYAIQTQILSHIFKWTQQYCCKIWTHYSIGNRYSMGKVERNYVGFNDYIASLTIIQIQSASLFPVLLNLSITMSFRQSPVRFSSKRIQNYNKTHDIPKYSHNHMQNNVQKHFLGATIIVYDCNFVGERFQHFNVNSRNPQIRANFAWFWMSSTSMSHKINHTF